MHIGINTCWHSITFVGTDSFSNSWHWNEISHFLRNKNGVIRHAFGTENQMCRSVLSPRVGGTGDQHHTRRIGSDLLHFSGQPGGGILQRPLHSGKHAYGISLLFVASQSDIFRWNPSDKIIIGLGNQKFHSSSITDSGQINVGSADTVTVIVR